MYIQVRTVDGKECVVLSISKLTTVAKLKSLVEDEMAVRPDLQRLFYRGKHLEEDYKLIDYNVNLNDVIQLMVKSDVPELTEETSSHSDSSERPGTSASVSDEDPEDEVETESLYYSVGDRVDGLDLVHGAWFEATIVKIIQRSGDLVYRIKWDADEDGVHHDIAGAHIRPRAQRRIKFRDLQIGQTVMLNYNIEKPKDIGYWYDLLITKMHKTKSRSELTGTIFVGRDRLPLEDRCMNTAKGEGIYAIEEPKLLQDRRPGERAAMSMESTSRRVAAHCGSCLDNPRRNCRECGCRVCSGKNDANLLLLCDECDCAYHTRCLDPPLESVPDEDEWYCPVCKNDENEIVKAGEKLKQTKKKNSRAVGNENNSKNAKRDWGTGFACVGRTKECTIVPPHHRGPVPGVEVGMSWKYRMQAAESGVHRPHVAGIHGRENDCAYSLVLSGGYEDDIDNGDEFLYTGSGGRDLSGNKRTAGQSSNQELLRMNKALALNCNCKLNMVDGAEAKDWKGGIPVRVVRNYKLSKHSKYAPTDGNRYDGIYKVVRYYPQKGKSGFFVWRYVLRRDDPAPAPWTKEGKRRIEALGLEMVYPDNYLEAKEKAKSKKRRRGGAPEASNGPAKKRAKRETYTLEKELSDFIDQDEMNTKVWDECKVALDQGKASFLKLVSDKFMCVCCQEIVYRPVTTPCAHNICKDCLHRSFLAGVYSCPCCRHPLGKNDPVNENQSLASALLLLYPGYQAGR